MNDIHADTARVAKLESERVEFLRQFVLSAVRAGSLNDGASISGLVSYAQAAWAAIEATKDGK